jgi:rifampicin phosphotransferase
MSEFIVPLARLENAETAGAKASNLARLIRLRQPVPDGFVLTNAALQAFLRAHNLTPVVGRLTHDLDVACPDRIRTAAEEIATAVRACDLPPELAADLDLALTPLLSDAVIIRSSALGEDAGDASFAGQLDSIGGAGGAAAVRRAILDVWASQWSARALTYQIARGRTLSGMGVVVQRQIASTISGVLFTVSPANPAEMMLEYCGGSGEALVAGRENPGRIAIGRDDLQWKPLASPEVAIIREWRLLNTAQLQSLGRRALAIERAFECPQDIEWTMDRAGRIWIVQARPITNTTGSTRLVLHDGFYTSGSTRQVLDERFEAAGSTRQVVHGGFEAAGSTRTEYWSNANVNENFPQPISPLLYSIARTGYYHYFRNLGHAFGFSARRIAAMEEPLRHIIGVHGARMYYNLTSIHGVLRSAPFGEHLAAWFNQFVGSEDTNAPAYVDVRLTPGTVIGQAGELAMIAFRTAWQYLFVTSRVERFERAASAYAARTRPELLPDRTSRELLDDFRAFIDIRNNRWLDASLADAASMVCYGALKRALSTAFPAADQAALHNSLLKALPNLPSSQPALELWKLSRMVRADDGLTRLFAEHPSAGIVQTVRHDPTFAAFGRALHAFLDDWGFRCSGELMLTVPSFQEEAAPLVDIIKAYAGMDTLSPGEHLDVQRDERLRETARIAALLRKRRLLLYVPGLHQWHVVSVMLRWTQHAIILRERARLKQALLYSRLRRVSLALGGRLVADGRLAQPDDIFMLTADEIDDLVSGYTMFPDHVRDLVNGRRHAHSGLSATTPPDSVRLAAGEYLGDFEHARPVDRENVGASDRPDSDIQRPILTGLGVCGGVTTARAAVLRDVTETHLLQPGDVLITRQTDPGWGAVFPLISGLVMERGGMLSHGAIIAREFGIPSVVGIGDATRRIPHGQDVHVDGDRGLVRIEGAA